MRSYHEYVPDQAYLLPPSLNDLMDADDPVRMVVATLAGLDFSAFDRAYAAERGRPPFHPRMMAGLYLYGAMRGLYSSRKLAAACQRDVSFIYVAGREQPDFHTVAEFRQRFREELKGLFLQVLGLCREAGLVRLGHVSLDGTKLRANASKHKAMSYGRMLTREKALEEEVRGWLREGERQDAADDAEYGPGDDGFSLPRELRDPAVRLQKIKEAKARLQAQAREKAEAAGKDPEEAVVPEKAQSNFTDPESRIMHTPDGFQQCYNAQAVVDADSQVVVAQEVSAAPTDVQRLVPMLANLAANGCLPKELSADAGYASEANFAACAEAHIDVFVALRRYRHDEPPDADPASPRASRRWPQRQAMRQKLATKEGKDRYKLRKQTVEPVFGQIKSARGLRQFLCRGLDAVAVEWSLACTAHNLLKLHGAMVPV